MTHHTDALRDAAQAAAEALSVTLEIDAPSLQCRGALDALRAALSAPADAVTGGSPDHMLQDQSRELSRWLSNQPDARLHAREAAAAIAAPADVPMHSHALTGPVAPLAGSVTDITAMSGIGPDQWGSADVPALPEPALRIAWSTLSANIRFWSADATQAKEWSDATGLPTTAFYSADQMRAALAQTAPEAQPVALSDAEFLQIWRRISKSPSEFPPRDRIPEFARAVLAAAGIPAATPQPGENGAAQPKRERSCK